jgi:uncharacterized protein
MPKIVTALVLLAAGFIVFTLSQHKDFLTFFRIEAEKPLVIFNDKTPLRVIVVEGALERKRGLSGRQSLEPTEGMLFVFSDDDHHGIWMKDMRFPIDIIWIDGEGTVVDVEHAARPESYPHIFEPSTPARYVIETNAHFAESFGIDQGSTVKLPAGLQ